MYRVTIRTRRGEDRRGRGRALEEALDAAGPEPYSPHKVKVSWTDGERDFSGEGATVQDALVALIEVLTAAGEDVS